MLVSCDRWASSTETFAIRCAPGSVAISKQSSIFSFLFFLMIIFGVDKEALASGMHGERNPSPQCEATPRCPKPFVLLCYGSHTPLSYVVFRNPSEVPRKNLCFR